jgi:hypothetical protein
MSTPLGLTTPSRELQITIARVLSFSGRIDWLRNEDAEEEFLRSATTLAWKLSYPLLSEISSVVFCRA